MGGVGWGCIPFPLDQRLKPLSRYRKSFADPKTHALHFKFVIALYVFSSSSGLPNRNGNRHVYEICSLAVDLRDLGDVLSIPHREGEYFKLKIGINTGNA